MTALEQAARLALDALDDLVSTLDDDRAFMTSALSAIDALRAALQQAEPVAWPKKRKPRAAEITESDEHYARSEGYDEGWNDCLAACMKQQAEPVKGESK
jgi:hypothetical protein